MNQSDMERCRAIRKASQMYLMHPATKLREMSVDGPLKHLGFAIEEVAWLAKAQELSFHNELLHVEIEKRFPTNPAAVRFGPLKPATPEQEQRNVTSAWDNFTQSLQTSRKILVDLRNAFLQFALDFTRQIGDMILKQDALNALSGTGVGNWLSKFVNGATGTDGAGSQALTDAGATLNTAGTALGNAAAALTAAAARMSLGGGLGGFGSLVSAGGSGAGD